MDNFCLRDKVKTEMMNFSLLYLEVYLLPPEPFIFGAFGILACALDWTFGMALRAAALLASAAFLFSLAALMALSRCF